MDYNLITARKGIEEALKYLANCTAAGLDIETSSLFPRHGEISLIQLSDGQKTFIIDCIELDARYSREKISSLSIDDAKKFWGEYKQSEYLNLLIPFLEAERPRKIIQNLKFEATWFQEKLGCEINGAFDTYLAGKLLDMPSDAKLDTLLEKYLKVTVSKEEQKSDWSGKLSTEQLEYACRDAFHLPALREKMVELLKQTGMIEVAAIEFNAVRAVAKMESIGFPIDKEMYSKLVEELKIRRDVRAKELEKVLNEAMGYVVTTQIQGGLWGNDSLITTGGVNLNSPVQVKKAFSKLGVELPSTNKQTINSMVTKFPQLKSLTDYRAEQILVTAFGDKIINTIDKETGRIHASFWQLKPACIVGSSLIPTSKGFIRIEDVEPLLESGVQLEKQLSVVNRRGELEKTSHIVKYNDMPTIKIKTQLGLELEGTLNHPVLTHKSRRYRSKKHFSERCEKWTALQDLTIDDHVKIPLNYDLGITEYKNFHFVNLTRNTSGVQSIIPHVLDESLAEFLGIYYADGSLHSNNGSYSIRISNSDQDVINRIKILSERLFGLTPSVYQEKTTITSSITSISLSQIEKSFEMKRGCVNKIVPKIILESPRSVIKAFIRGMTLDSTVYTQPKISNITLKFTVSNKESAQTVQHVLLSLGIVSDVRGSNNVWNINIRNQNYDKFNESIGFIQKKKDITHGFTFKSTNSYWTAPDGSHIWVKIKNIESSFNTVYDFTVPDTHSFVSNGIVSHNTGRFAASNPNLQQMPHTREFRECFKPIDPNRCFVIADYSGIELRILAQISQDSVMIDAFNNNKDLHSITAIAAFNLPCSEKEVKTLYPEQRVLAKGLNFGVVYGIGANKYADNTGISKNDAKKAIKGFYTTYKGVEKYLYGIEDFGVKNRHVKTLAGRKLQLYFDPTNEKEIGMAKRNARNYPIQGCIGGSTKIQLETHGYINIEDAPLNTVEKVWDGEKFVDATIITTGKKRLVKVTFMDGNTIECSPIHKFWTCNTHGTWKWVEAQNLNSSYNYVELTKEVKDFEFSLNLDIFNGISHNAKTTSIDNITDRFDMGLWLGRLASDGCVMPSGQITQVIAEHEKEILPIIEGITVNLTSVSTRDCEKYRTDRLPIYNVVIHSKSLATQLIHYGIKQRIPDFLWKTKEGLRGYLRGIFDGDGTVNKDGVSLKFGKNHTHEKWAKEIQQALYLFGIRSRINYNSGSINVCIMKKDSHLFADKIGFINQDKQRKIESIKFVKQDSRIYGKAVKVKSVEITNNYVKMYDVLNSESHVFMANGLVTHNTSADILKLALGILYPKLSLYKTAFVVNIVHDEIIIECERKDAPEIKSVLSESMLEAAYRYLPDVYVEAESSISESWAEK